MWRARCRAEQLTLELRSRRAGRRADLRAGDVPPAHAPRRGLPVAAGAARRRRRVALPAEAFVETISRVARSASRDETRPVLTGILMSASGRELRMVATDSYRLSVKETALEPPLERRALEANVPARALQELVRIAQQAEAEAIAVSVGQNQVDLRARRRGAVLAADRRPVPELPPAPAGVRRSRAAPVERGGHRRGAQDQPAGAEERAAAAQLQRGTLAVSAQTPDVGEAREAIPVPFHGEPFEIGFNPEFLRDGLESIESDELVLKLISPLRPGLIESPGNRRLRLSHHADPAERVRPGRRSPRLLRASSRAAARLPHLRTRRSAPRLGADGRTRAQRGRQVEPARGDLLRLHRPLAAHAQRARAGALRRQATRVEVCARGRAATRTSWRSDTLARAGRPAEKRMTADGAPVERLLDVPSAR